MSVDALLMKHHPSMVGICCPVQQQCGLGSGKVYEWSIISMIYWITHKADDVDQPLSHTENRFVPVWRMHKLVKALSYNLQILEIIAEWLVCPLVEPVFHFQEMRANMLVMLFSIHNKCKLGGATPLRGEDGLTLYSRKNRESSPHILMTVNETIMKHVC
jgi:hypothetical protein